MEPIHSARPDVEAACIKFEQMSAAEVPFAEAMEAALSVALETIRKDAARYRWLRDESTMHGADQKATPWVVVGTGREDSMPWEYFGIESLDDLVDECIVDCQNA